MSSHYNVIQSGFIGFTTENKFAQPHVQECSVLNFTQGTVLHVILDNNLYPLPGFTPVCLVEPL
jgi:hypothetical protein